MDRQPLILLALALAACKADELGLDDFDGPVSAAVLSPEDGGPFSEPIGFVANSRSGTIVPLDLKHGTYLSDQPASPFLDPRRVATGDQRQLNDLAVWAGPDNQVLLFTADMTNKVLVQAPYLTGADPYPQVPELSATDPVFVDADGSGDQPTLADIELRNGYTTTEDWSIEFDGSRWWAKGSRSGRQNQQPVSGDEFCSDRREICFTLSGDATEGDRFELHTDTGLVEVDLGGSVLGLLRLPGTDLLAAGVWDGANGSVVFWDIAAGAELGRLTPAPGAQPWRFTTSPDGAVIYAGDAQNPAVYAITLDPTDPAASAVQVIATDAPIAALARVDSLDYTHLFVGLSELNRVDVYDLETESWVDVNPLDDTVSGIQIYSPISGLSATPEPIKLQETTAWDGRLEDNTVVVSTFVGTMMMLEGSTGCLAVEQSGPRLESESGEYVLKYTDFGTVSNPLLWPDDATGQSVQINPCGGVARSEVWTAIYDEGEGAWVLKAAISGEQDGRAIEDQRYISDDGAISFTILAGDEASSSGDAFLWQVDDGVLRVSSTPPTDANPSGEPLSLPGPPVVFQYESGPTGGGWDHLDRRTFALLPVTGSDKVLRIRLTNWEVQVGWQ